MTIIELNNEQFQIRENSIIYADRLKLELNKQIIIKKVLFHEGQFGFPFLNNVKVLAIVDKIGKDRKMIIQKYHAKKNYKKKMGFRRLYTRLKVLKIEKIAN